jgi:hypothetical protein
LSRPARVTIQWERVDQDRHTRRGSRDWSGSGYESRGRGR